jgi:hypothetical protein
MRSSLGFVLLVGTVLSVLASAILLYISIATTIGPWIAPTLLLVSSLIFKLFRKNSAETPHHLVMVSALASGGGIIAVGIGFSLPMLYFLSPVAFQELISTPWHFMVRITITILLAGSFGIFVGKFFAKTILKKNDLSFPISRIAYQIASAQSHRQDAQNLFKGISATLILCIFRDGFYMFKGLITKHLTLLNTAVTGPLIFSIWPTLWSVGYTIGLSSTIPLLIGLVSRYAILYPINNHSLFLPFSLFAPLKEEGFIVAFCSGMIISDLILSILSNPGSIIQYVKTYIAAIRQPNIPLFSSFLWHPIKIFLSNESQIKLLVKSFNRIEPFIAIASFITFFSFLGFSLPAQCIILIAMLIALYEVNRLCGKIGLLQIGRFSAFILIPVVLLFKINSLQMTALTLFFNVAAGVSSDLLFDYKTAELSATNRDTIHGLQWIGLIISSITISVVCYILFTNIPLGSEELFAHRGRAKALLMQSLHFNHIIVSAGFLFGYLLKRFFRVSPTMAFGGIIMPSQITLGFLFGGLLSKLAGKNRDSFLPFCSGVFATETLWLLISLGIRLISKSL